MSLSALQSLAKNAIAMSRELKSFYASYMNATAMQEKGLAFSRFVRAYQDFNGYLISIYNTIKQYYDLFVHICNEIDPTNKEGTLIQYKSDIDHNELLADIYASLFNT